MTQARRMRDISFISPAAASASPALSAAALATMRCAAVFWAALPSRCVCSHAKNVDMRISELEATCIDITPARKLRLHGFSWHSATNLNSFSSSISASICLCRSRLTLLFWIASCKVESQADAVWLTAWLTVGAMISVQRDMQTSPKHESISSPAEGFAGSSSCLNGRPKKGSTDPLCSCHGTSSGGGSNCSFGAAFSIAGGSSVLFISSLSPGAGGIITFQKFFTENMLLS
mmetsp:Transcript_11942/g.21115  ORF Transcript_11942/g.21115 Transcript_11942/m.21115 type:complete len:232 (-) Transcript_11942:170-865(-)